MGRWEEWKRVRVDEFDYVLPAELIAQHPLDNRADARLLVADPVMRTLTHSRFACISSELRQGDVLVLNNSKVLPARLHGHKRDSGGQVELLLTRPIAHDTWEALCKPAKRLRPGSRIEFPGGASAEVMEARADGVRSVRFELTETMESFLQRIGEVPLPPYIHAPLVDAERYQTVYARPLGSVAAPTAGLHFTQELLAELRQQGVTVVEVTLHVGIGTFRPVLADDVESHHMHSEWYDIPETTAMAINQARDRGRRVIAVGTTAMRTLESASAHGRVAAGSGETSIFIYPGYTFRVVDALVTNFHLPKSTLFMLVCAMMGTEFAKQAYEQAVAARYRFFSFGDAMFISRRCTVDA